MILCIATANLIFIYAFFSAEVSITLTAKQIQIAQPQIHFVTQVFQNFFKDT